MSTFYIYVLFLSFQTGVSFATSMRLPSIYDQGKKKEKLALYFEMHQ